VGAWVLCHHHFQQCASMWVYLCACLRLFVCAYQFIPGVADPTSAAAAGVANPLFQPRASIVGTMPGVMIPGQVRCQVEQ
jgi:hypothetical protein